MKRQEKDGEPIWIYANVCDKTGSGHPNKCKGPDRSCIKEETEEIYTQPSDNPMRFSKFGSRSDFRTR
jgi:hypothetical protein